MKMKNENMKTMIMLLVLFLLGGFMLVGATDTTTVNDRTQADNDAQQRVLPLDMHTSRYSVRKPTKDEKKKALWRKAKCDASRDLHHFFDVTRESAKNQRRPGTKLQKIALKKFGMKAPRQVAVTLATDIYNRCHKLGDESVQSVLNSEVEELLKFSTKRIKDSTYAVDYTLHVLKDLGGGMKHVFDNKGLSLRSKNKKNPLPPQEREERLAVRRKLTVNVDNLLTALKASKDIVRESGYEIQIKPYMHHNKTSVTGTLWHSMSFSGSATIKAITHKVSKDFDSTTYNAIEAEYTPEALKAEAGLKLMEWVDLQVTDTKAFMQACPEETPMFKLVNNFRDIGKLISSLQKKGIDATEEKKEWNALGSEFVIAYADHKKNTMPVRQELLDIAVDKAITKKLRDLQKNFHSWEIMVTREHRRNETDVTMLWHLSHMTEYKAAKNGFAKNNHTGARYLLGPSNYVTVPDSIGNGYVRALRDTSAGSRQFTGDTVSQQMILPTKNNMFTVTKDMKDRDVKKVMSRRRATSHLYTMINVGLGKNPKQPAHLVMGLYSNPALIESQGQMAAPVLRTIKPETKSPNSKRNKRKSRRRKQGPNTVKNTQKVNEAAKALDVDENVVSPEEIAQYAPSRESDGLEAHMADMVPYGSMTNSDLKEHCRAAGLKVSGNKAELVERLTSAHAAQFDDGNDVFDQLMKTGTASNGETSEGPKTPKRVKKGRRKTPTPTRGRKTGTKSDN